MFGVMMATVAGAEASDAARGSMVLRVSAAEKDVVDAWVATWGMDVWSNHIVIGHDRFVDVATNVTGAAALRKAGLSHSVMIADLQGMLAANAAVNKGRAPFATRPGARFVDEYHPLEDIHAKMAELAARYGAEVVPSIATSHEGRSIPVLKFGGAQSSKTFWIQGGIHAREWISPATVMYIAEALLSSTDPDVVRIVSEIEFQIAPVVNPDGYAYTWSRERLWRKNRRPDGLCSGVDLNRNWAEKWGTCGASTNPCSDTYRGSEPFSEPESTGIANYVVAEIAGVSRREIVAAIDFHAYGELILRPYGWALPREATPQTDPETSAMAARMRQVIFETHGRLYTSEHAAELYCASGGADDWFFANATKRSVAGGFCIELRDTGQYGFLLPEYEIEPTGEENFAAVLQIAREVAAGAASQH